MFSDGLKSSEFWLVAALFALVVLNGPLSLGLSSQELISLAIGVAGYSGSRGLAKSTPSTQTNIVSAAGPDAATTATKLRAPGA